MATMGRPDTPKAVADALTELRRGYEVGRMLLRDATFKSRSKSTGIGGLAAAQGCYAEKGRKLHKFARLYTQADLDQLCELCQRHETAFSLTKICLLLPIADRRARLKLQREAVMNRWSLTKLRIEIRHRFGRDPAGRGRKPIRPRDATEALAQAFDLAGRLVRWHTHMSTSAGKDYTPPVLPQNVAKRLTTAVAALKGLQTAVKSAMAR